MTSEPADLPYTGGFVGREHHYAVRVYYEDTDAGGVVYHANYLRYFERARSEMMRAVGADHVETLAAGIGGYVVAEANIRYRRPARLGEALVIVSTIGEVRSAATIIQQNVMCDGHVVAEGRIAAVFVGADGRPKRQPEAWITAFTAQMGEK